MSANTPAAQAVQAVQATKPTDAAPIPSAQVKPEGEQAPDPRMEAFARKERQLHKMRKELDAEREQLKTRISEYETGYIPKSRLTEDPFGVLSEAGLSYDTLTAKLLEAPNMNDPAIRALMGKIKALEDKQGQAAKQVEEAQEKQYKEAITQISNDVKQLVESNEAYEMIKESGLHEAVVELIEQTYNSEGYLMDTEEACKQVEDHLLVEAERFAKTKKLQAKLAIKPEAVTQDPKQASTSTQMKTLTNAVSATPTKRLSDKERRERAIAAFNGKLNQ